MSIAGNHLNAPRTKKEIEESYASILAPYAVITGERQDKSEDYDQDNRAVFQRDRDRIIHSEAFRRLMYKTQVFVNHEGDGYRTRLTHTLEVSQLARGICKSLALNEDLAEAIALGHDLGHTPFGHAIEEFFDKELREKKLGRFFHNEQSIRVVEYLEKRRKDKIGLNLSREVREGILKHTSRRSGAFEHLEPWAECSHLEGQIVRLVDTIAYTCHDLDDAVKSGIVSRSLAQNKDFKDNLIRVSKRLEKEAGLKESNVSISFEPYDNTFFTRYLIHYFVTDLTQNIFRNIKAYNIHNLSNVREQGEKGNVIVCLSEDVNSLFSELKKFITQYIYHSQTISLMDEKAVTVVKAMYYKLMERPTLLPPNWLYRYEHIDSSANISGIKNDRARVVCDYISCMTDRSALEEHDRLFNPKIKL